jgi:hypothetical protein
MRYRLFIVTAVAAIALALAVVEASGESGHRVRHKTIHVDARLTAEKHVDQAPQGDSPGDVALASGNLLAPDSTRKVGHVVLDCVNIPPHYGECSITFALHGGHIASLGSFGPGFSGDTSGNDPVIGGTGIYRKARGYVHTQEGSGNAQKYTIHLTY